MNTMNISKEITSKSSGMKYISSIKLHDRYDRPSDFDANRNS